MAMYEPSDWAEPELEQIAESVDFDPILQELLATVHNAASELHGQGAKSDRIAQQLYTALARFHNETGRL